MGRDHVAQQSRRGVPGFNPRARVGRDSSNWTDMIPCKSFNPRARVGRDIIIHTLAVRDIRFNPRARVGRDIVGRR